MTHALVLRLLLLAARAQWARFRQKCLLLSERDVECLLGLLAVPGLAAAPAMSFPRDLRAVRSALIRVRLGADAESVTASLWGSFRVIPSDIAGYPGPVRMVLEHGEGGYWTALPWEVPESFVAAEAASRPTGVIDANFEHEDDSPLDEVAA